MTTPATTEKPKPEPRLGLTEYERKLLSRMEPEGRVLRKCASGPFYGSYYEVADEHGERIGARVQLKVLKRAEERGYISYGNKAFTLSEAGRVALKYLREAREMRKKL